MNPEQALKILDQVCANTPANRQDHQAMSQALRSIQNLIQETKTPDKKENPEKENKDGNK